MIALMLIIALCDMVTLFTPGHLWSHIVTVVTVEVKDLNNNGLDGYYGSMAPN